MKRDIIDGFALSTILMMVIVGVLGILMGVTTWAHQNFGNDGLVASIFLMLWFWLTILGAILARTTR